MRDERSDHSGVLTMLGVSVVALVMFFALLGKRDIATSHEARVAQTARQMAAIGWPWESSARVHASDPSGHTAKPVEVNPWLIPVINGHIRLEKPPLPYWCAAVCFKLVGVSERWARFTPALLGALATLLLADLARQTMGRRAALIAALVWMTSLFVVDEFRKTMADPYLAFFTTLAITCWTRYRSPTEIKRVRPYLISATVAVGEKGGVPHLISAVAEDGSGKRRVRPYLFPPALAIVCFYVALAMGALAKGPLILVVVAPAIVAFEVCFERTKCDPTRFVGAHVLGILLFCAIALAWPVVVTRELPFARQLWWGESVGKISEDVERARPFWFYVANAFQLALPWTPMWIAGIVLAGLRFRARAGRAVSGVGFRLRTQRRARRRAFPLVWYALYILLFSCFGVKKDAYLLPMMAAQTLIITDALVLMFAWTKRARAFRGMPAVLAGAQAAVGVGFAIAMAVMHADALRLVLAFAAAFGSVAAIVAIVRPASANRWLVLQSLGYACLVVAVVGSFNVDRDNARSPRAFAAAVARYAERSRTPIALAQLAEDASFYLPLPLTQHDESRASERVIVIIDDNHRDIERGLITPDAHFFTTYAGDAAIRFIRRVPIDIEDSGNLRWKAYELTFDVNRM